VQAQFLYTTDGGTITITGYYGSDDVVAIPSLINGLPVTRIGDWAFDSCTTLTSITIPNSVISIGNSAFSSCTSLTSVTIPNGVASIGSWAFSSCTKLTGVYFRGNAPGLGSFVFWYTSPTVYYLPEMTGWGTTFGGCPTALWRLQIQTGDASFGVRTNQFGFNITWASGRVIVVEACTNLASPNWSPLRTNTLSADALYFSDPEWTNYPRRFYRLRSP
jgi:hypothetical protein